MCGVLAWIGLPGSQPKRGQLERMNNRMTHRGPDGSGVDIVEHVGLAHRRLAIIDLEGATQPMTGPGGVRISFNGEIYNFRALRSELIALGHEFKLDSDTEVLVHAAAEWGPDCLTKLNGMFAMVVDDPGRDLIWAARDRMGQKPLFAVNASMMPGLVLGFASELKAYHGEDQAVNRFDRDAVARFLAYDFVPDSDGIFEGVDKVAPGEVWLLDRSNPLSGPTRRAYWELPFGVETEHSDPLVDLDRAIDEAVRARLVSDVPLGIFLSGGIDSSLIAAHAVRHTDPARLKTFAIGFEEKSFDESEHAEAVAKHLGVTHRCRVIGASDLLDTVPEIFAGQDEPFADPSIIPTNLLSRFAREEVTVALGGDGGDELFLGYATFVAEQLLRPLSWAPKKLWKTGHVMADALLPTGSGHYTAEYKIKRFLGGASRPLPERHQIWIGGALPGVLDGLMPDRKGPARYEPSRGIWNDSPGSEFQRLSAVYARTYLAAGVLQKVDRASMMHSLEVRAPFLDPAVVVQAARCPDKLRIHRGTTKVALRKLAERQLPASITKRPKKGFGIPLAQWLRGPLKDWSAELLDEALLRRHNLVRPAAVERLRQEHLSGKRNHAKILWNLCALSAFAETVGR